MRNPRIPALTIEKLIIKDGESIHMKKRQSPKQAYNPTFANDSDAGVMMNSVG